MVRSIERGLDAYQVSTKENLASHGPFDRALWKICQTLKLALQPWLVSMRETKRLSSRAGTRNSDLGLALTVQPKYVSARPRIAFDHQQNLARIQC